jgi:hypothetical protein
MVREWLQRGRRGHPATQREMAADCASCEPSGNFTTWVREGSTLLYVLSHTNPHTKLHVNKSTEA